MTSDEATSRWLEGDASVHLEELIAGQLPEFGRSEAVGQLVEVEVVGPNLRMSGDLNIGAFRRVSDYLNNHEGLLTIHGATVLRRNGEPTRVRSDSIWVASQDMTLIGVLEPSTTVADPGQQVAKVPVPLVVVTPGHTLTGEVYIPEGADLTLFIVSPSPTFIPLTDVRTRSLADRRIVSRFPFALLNRRHIVATTRLMPGMMRGGEVL